MKPRIFARTCAAWLASIAGIGPVEYAHAAPAIDHAVLGSPVDSVVVAGRPVRYRTVTGQLPVPDGHGGTLGHMFHIDYLAAEDGARRPVTFVFNGGPGMSSAPLHIAAFAPRGVRLSGPGQNKSEPAELAGNPDTILDFTDLVFIDAIGTGHSSLSAGVYGKTVWGIDQDLDAFAAAIEQWLATNHRSKSPLFLFGESYGGTRSAGLALRLQNDGVRLAGITMLAPMLSVTSRDPAYDQYYVALLPSMATTAFYHGVTRRKVATVDAVAREAEAFAQGDYLSALAKGSDLPPDRERAIALRMSSLIGIAPSTILANHLRLNFPMFLHLLLKPRGEFISSIDTRYTARSRGPAWDDDYDHDPQRAAAMPLIRAGTNAFLASRPDCDAGSYRIENYGAVQRDWDWLRRAESDLFPWDTRSLSTDLAMAMNSDRGMKVMLLYTYYDFSEPYFATKWDVRHMQISRVARGNITEHYYATGHMPYVDVGAKDRMRADLKSFYADALASIPRSATEAQRPALP